MELILQKAQLSRLELFKKEILGMSESLEVQRGQTGMENKMNQGLSIEPSRSQVQNKLEEALLHAVRSKDTAKDPERARS